MPGPEAPAGGPETPSQPTVSVVLPTLNEGARLGRCLASIRGQDYPQDRIEILVADGGSIDDTLDIARSFDCQVIDAAGSLAEAAKGLALQRATGDLVAMIDADNTVVDPAWLGRAAAALARHPEALGFESYYPLDPRDPPLNRYLTGLLQISDPWARAVASKPRSVNRDADGSEILELPADGSYPTGANGFLFRRELLEDLGNAPFHEATFFPRLIRGGRRRLLKHPRCRVHHAYVRGWGDFYRKKQRVAMHYLLRREEVSGAWDAELSGPRRWLAMLYCATVVGPMAEGLLGALRSRRWEWLLHPVACPVAVIATVVGVARSRLAGSTAGRRDASRRLKPGQPSSAAPSSAQESGSGDSRSR